MNLEDLRSARRTERDRDGLQSLRDSFYRDVAAYLGDLKAERERAAEAADDPFSDPEVRRLTEEIETAEEVVESIYERRIGKVVDRASFAAADMRHETEGLTAEEQDLFDDLVARIEQNRERVLDALDTDADGADAATDDEEDGGTDEARTEPDGTHADGSATDAPDPNDLLAEAMGGAADGAAGDDPPPVGSETTDGGVPTGAAPDDASPPAGRDDGTSPPAGGGDHASSSMGRDGAEPDGGTPQSDAETDRRTVYVTQDVGEIFGVDERTYSLAAEDVVDLPTDNARALVERDAAEPIE